MIRRKAIRNILSFSPSRQSFLRPEGAGHSCGEDGSSRANDPLPLSDHSRLMVPGSYLVLSSMHGALREAYDLHQIWTMAGAGGDKDLRQWEGNPLPDRQGRECGGQGMDYGEEMHAANIVRYPGNQPGEDFPGESGKRSGKLAFGSAIKAMPPRAG